MTLLLTNTGLYKTEDAGETWTDITRKENMAQTTPVYTLPELHLRRGILESYLGYHYSGDSREIEGYINESINHPGQGIVKDHKSSHVNRKVCLWYHPEFDDFSLTEMEEVPDK